MEVWDSILYLVAVEESGEFSQRNLCFMFPVVLFMILSFIHIHLYERLTGIVTKIIFLIFFHKLMVLRPQVTIGCIILRSYNI